MHNKIRFSFRYHDYTSMNEENLMDLETTEAVNLSLKEKIQFLNTVN